MPTLSRPGVKDTSPVAHARLAQPMPQVELVMREAPNEDRTKLQVFLATGNYQPEPSPMPMLWDFPATGPSQPRPIPNPKPMLRDSPETGPDRAESVLQDIPATRLGCTMSSLFGTATASVPTQPAMPTILGPATWVSSGSPSSSSGQQRHVLFPSSTFEVVNPSMTTFGPPLRCSARSACPALSYEPETGKWVKIRDP
jgi:hypothetical protein